ncbi:MAG: MBL fold metallo-hydrolase [Acutalibacteraceae bacterium]
MKIDRFNKEQKSVFKIKNCTAVHGSECFLIMTDSANILIDSGYGFCAKETSKNIKKYLGEKTLDYLLLTHSHYDHAMGSAQIGIDYPDVTIIASEYCAKILEKPTAREAIRKMDQSAAKIYGMPPGEDLTGRLRVDRTVKDGEEFMLGDYLIRAVALPGHTKCCMGYYFVNQKVMISCETIGLYSGYGTAMPGCLVGYQMTIDSCDKIFALEMNEMLVSHSGMLYNEDIYEFLKKARECTDECKNFIVGAWKDGLDFNGIVEKFKERYYSEEISEFYPEPALLANLKAQIPMFIKECGN